MIDQDGLNVWHDDQLIGYLWCDDINRIGFRYSNEWLQAPVFALSLTLPLQADAFNPDSTVAHRYFSNLLPEGSAREQIVRDLKISNTEFALLRAIGGECAGAISILPVERSPGVAGAYHLINNNDLRTLIIRRGHGYTGTTPEEQPRLSLAGAQNKCAVFATDDHYYHPSGNAASTHILKFESAEYRHLPVYEVFTSMLAATVALPVVPITLHENNGRQFAKVTRYDRVIKHHELNNGELTATVGRLHQEDFCQALGFGYDKKYQTDGGPAFADCYRLLADISTEPAIDTQELIRWLIFNVLAGNSDGHAKNISLLQSHNANDQLQTRLAPFYDLLCTRAIDRIDSKLAFDVGGQRSPDQVSAKHWEQLAKECDISPRYLKQLVKELAEQLLDGFSTARTQFESLYGECPALQRVKKVISSQVKLVNW